MSAKLLEHDDHVTGPDRKVLRPAETATERFHRLSDAWPAFHESNGRSRNGARPPGRDGGAHIRGIRDTCDSRDTRRAPLRRAAGRSLGKWTALGLCVVMLAAFGGPLLRRVWGGFHPMAERTVDRTGPALLAAISDLHDYRAAEGTFQVTVDIEKDAKWLPAAIRGERVVLNAVGHVDAGVDFSGLSASAVAVDPSTKAVVVTLPRAQLRGAHVDLAASHIVQHKRGLLDRLGSAIGDAPATDRSVYELAEKKLHAAAVSSDLVARAETNTRQMLVAFAKGLGHENVTVTFAESADLAGPLQSKAML